MNKPYWFPDARAFLAIILVLGMITIMFTVMFKPPGPDNDVLKVLIGAYSGVGFASVIQFYFGSTSSSKDKDDTISRMSGNPPPSDNLTTTAKTETTKTIVTKPDEWVKP